MASASGRSRSSRRLSPPGVAGHVASPGKHRRASGDRDYCESSAYSERAADLCSGKDDQSTGIDFRRQSNATTQKPRSVNVTWASSNGCAARDLNPEPAV